MASSKAVKTWAVKDAFNQGKDVGSLLGHAVFEVITAVLGTKGLDKLAKGGKLALFLEKLKLDKAVRAVEKLVEAKNNLLIFRTGMESGEILARLANRKNQIVREIIEEATTKGLKTIPEDLVERAIRKVARESLEETGKKVSKEFIDETVEKFVTETSRK